MLPSVIPTVSIPPTKRIFRSDVALSGPVNTLGYFMLPSVIPTVSIPPTKRIFRSDVALSGQLTPWDILCYHQLYQQLVYLLQREYSDLMNCQNG